MSSKLHKIVDTNKRCKHIKREGESCRLNNNCTYPDCEIETFNNKREMSEVNPNYNPQADFDNFGEEMGYIVETTPKEVLKEEWDKVLAEYGTDTHDKILSMTDEFIQSNRSEGQTYAHYHYDMMADFALHLLETFNTKER